MASLSIFADDVSAINEQNIPGEELSDVAVVKQVDDLLQKKTVPVLNPRYPAKDTGLLEPILISYPERTPTTVISTQHRPAADAFVSYDPATMVVKQDLVNTYFRVG